MSVRFRLPGSAWMLIGLWGTSMALANSAPVVSNVTASQRQDYSKLIDIRYNLADADGDPCTVWVTASDDGGATWKVPIRTFSGAIGNNIPPGSNKLITWDAGEDMPGKLGSFRVRVWADDGQGPGSAKAFVGAGPFPYQNTTSPGSWVSVDSFLIDKYEVTNAFYCQFLNAGGNDDHWSASQEITRQGSPGNYTYSVVAGRADYPVRYVSWDDATAFAQWRSQLEGVTYRLPTEQEWEKAAAWDPAQQHYYIYGFHRDTIDCSWCVYNNCYGSAGPMPVGYLNGTGGRNDAKSYYGGYDMSGNVWEWT
ncbi:MAG: SUMF1/EgtB/PvdO family nonheme iron enzyme, partial [Planctomycetes bacterium]|nr:SUMF1/EgtB/PvdO family nonheme iron enzyme [Planctomycetota bacterium]